MTEAGMIAVPAGDREALAAALARVLSDGALRASLAARSRRAQELYFSWPAIASSYVAAFEGARGNLSEFPRRAEERQMNCTIKRAGRAGN